MTNDPLTLSRSERIVNLGFSISVCLGCLILWMPVTVEAEQVDPLFQRFEMIGAGGRHFRVELENKPGTGITIRTAPGPRPAHTVIWDRSSPELPTFTCHSRELGQLAIVRCFQGGGTGVGYWYYFVFVCTADGPQILHEGLADCHEISGESSGRSFKLQSEFRAIEKGFAQIVRFDLVSTWDENRIRPLGFEMRAHVGLRFRVNAGNVEPTMRCEIDRKSAEALLDIIQAGPAAPRQWAATMFRRHWPKLTDALNDYLAAADPQCHGKMQALRVRVDELVTQP